MLRDSIEECETEYEEQMFLNNRADYLDFLYEQEREQKSGIN